MVLLALEQKEEIDEEDWKTTKTAAKGIGKSMLASELWNGNDT